MHWRQARVDGARRFTAVIPSPAHRALGVVAVLLTACILAGVFVSVAGATGTDRQFSHGQSGDVSPPRIVSASRVNDTAFNLTIADNHDVDETTIRAAEFAAEAGTIVDASSVENGSNTTVTLVLDAPVDEANLTVAAIGNTNIADTSGNVLGADGTRRSIVVRGMDGVEPRIFAFTASNATGGPATLELEATEPLSAFNISLGGVASGYLTRADFTRSGTAPVYTAEYTPPADGTVRFTLFSYTDTAGNTQTLKFTRRITADLTPPDAQAGVDLAASSNLTLVFDGGGSTDTSGVANYTWNFGDGTTASGERVSHTFDPGAYTVELEAADPYGNAATDTIPLNLSTGAGNETAVDESTLAGRRATTVTVDRAGSGVGADAVIRVDAARNGTVVRIPAATANDTALVSHGNATLASLNVTLATNRSFDLGVSMAGPGSVADAATPTGTTPLAGLTVVHAVPDEDITAATFSLSVNRSALSAVGAQPSNLTLRRYHDGSWNPLPTTVATETNATVSLAATAPGFSRFALTAATENGGSAPSSTSGSATLTVTEATLDTQTVRQGEQASATVTVRNDGTATGTATVAVALNETVVTEGTSPSVQPGASRSFQIQFTPSEPGTYAVTADDTAAGTLVVETRASNDTDEQAGTTTDTARQFVVTNVTLNRTSIAPGETLVVNATVRNRGPNPGFYTAGLAVNGGVVVTEESPPMPANASRTFAIRYAFNNSGEFSVSVNGTTGGTVTVAAGGGGLFAPVTGLLSALPIPMGLLRPLVTFVLAPLFVIWAILKLLALYLGY